MKKVRSRIPEDRASEILFSHDHVCCVCNARGKAVQIHHINENPADHRIQNLTVLCLEDHNRTQVNGGFGRHLSTSEVKRYRDDWLARVRRHRDRIDSEINTALGDEPLVTTGAWTRPNNDVLTVFSRGLPEVRRSVIEKAHLSWDSGTNSLMLTATYDVIDFYQRIWVHLAGWYPPSQFDHKNAELYVSDFVGDRTAWHRALNQPDGEGTSGTILGLCIAGGVMEDLDRMISDTVQALVAWLEIAELDYSSWKIAWDGAGSRNDQ